MDAPLLEREEEQSLAIRWRDNGDEKNSDSVQGLGAAELLADIKFGAQAVFGENASNKLPTEADIELITDR